MQSAWGEIAECRQKVTVFFIIAAFCDNLRLYTILITFNVLLQIPAEKISFFLNLASLDFHI